MIVIQYRNQKLLVKISDNSYNIRSTPRPFRNSPGFYQSEDESVQSIHRMIIIEKFCQEIVDDMIAYSNRSNLKLFLSLSHELRQPVKATISQLQDLRG